MALHAVQNVGTALTVTRQFLRSLDAAAWLQLAFVAFFLGGGMDLQSAQFDVSGGTDRLPDAGAPVSIPDDGLLVAAAVALVAVALLLALGYALVGSVMEFVFVESLRRGTVSVRRDWRRRWRQGLRLFGFRVAIGLPILLAFLAWLALAFGPLLAGGSWSAVSVPVLVLGLPVLFLAGLLYGLVSAFTTAFVVPIMIQTDTGVLAAWRRLWDSIRSAWTQYLAYAVVGFLLTVVAGFITSIALGVAAVAVGAPLAVVGVATHLAVSLASPVGTVVLVLLGLLFVAGVAAAWALIRVPIESYLRYHALLVLGDVEPDLDLVADRRE